jgi:hypothetical protein
MRKKHFLSRTVILVLTKQMKALHTIILLLLMSTGFSQEPSGVHILTLASYSAGFADPFSHRSHPSILARMKNRTAGIYSEQKFLIREWKTAVAAFVLPTPSGNFGLWLDYSGTENYSGFKSSISYARSLTTTFDVGLQFCYKHAGIPGYTSRSAYGYTVSALFHLNDKLDAGVNFSNEGEEESNEKPVKKLPEKFSFGFGYTVSQLVFLTSEITKAKQSPVNISAGLHYAFHEKMFFRMGFESATGSWQLGAGIRWRQLCFQLIADMHPVLGITPGLAMMTEEKKTVK